MIYRYLPTKQADWILLQWLSRMETDGDLLHTLSESVRIPSEFLKFFESRPLFYKLDSFLNIAHAAWFEPCMGSAWLSYYVAPGFRKHQKEKCFFLYDMIDYAFKEGANCICGVIQERETPEATDIFIRIHERLGYTYSGRVKKFFDGKDAHLAAITDEEWENNNGRLKKFWHKDRATKQQFHDTTSDTDGVDAGAEQHISEYRAGDDGIPEQTEYWEQFCTYPRFTVTEQSA